MKNALANLLNSQSEVFGFFDQVFLFGSSLWSLDPNDIDILLVYETGNPQQANIEKDKIEMLLTWRLPGYVIDFTTLSKIELEQTDFLSKVMYWKIKG